MSDDAAIDRALGWSLALEPLDPLDGAAGGLDVEWRRVSGVDALMQALTLAFATLRGSDLFNVRFGFAGVAALAEESDPVLRRERVRVAVIDTLRAEPRVARVLSVRFADEAGAEGGAAAFAAPPSRVLEVEAVFEAATGRVHRITVGGEALDG